MYFCFSPFLLLCICLLISLAKYCRPCQIMWIMEHLHLNFVLSFSVCNLHYHSNSRATQRRPVHKNAQQLQCTCHSNFKMHCNVNVNVQCKLWRWNTRKHKTTSLSSRGTGSGLAGGRHKGLCPAHKEVCVRALLRGSVSWLQPRLQHHRWHFGPSLFLIRCPSSAPNRVNTRIKTCDTIAGKKCESCKKAYCEDLKMTAIDILVVLLSSWFKLDIICFNIYYRYLSMWKLGTE